MKTRNCNLSSNTSSEIDIVIISKINDKYWKWWPIDYQFSPVLSMEGNATKRKTALATDDIAYLIITLISVIYVSKILQCCNKAICI